MKTKVLIFCSALPLTALMTSGCYTVLSSPYETASLHDEDLVRAKSRDVEAPTVGQFDDRDYMDDLYRYPGVRGGYGRYGGYYGGYGGYGGGYYPTSGYYPSYYGGYPSYYGGYGGYGPYSYGYDPYYRSSGGYYVPPGYELVSTRQLDDLRAASRLNTTPMVTDPARATEVQRREEEVWQRRVEPRVRSAPTPTPRSSVSSPPSAPTPKASATTTSAPASKSSATKKSAKPKKRRR
ncbi:MAG: hypothetical protein OXE49_07935 [Gemmatimonadetes bacterium]|nr:hypothetical protein [Gemmatimonadota bacterium]